MRRGNPLKRTPLNRKTPLRDKRQRPRAQTSNVLQKRKKKAAKPQEVIKSIALGREAFAFKGRHGFTKAVMTRLDRLASCVVMSRDKWKCRHCGQQVLVEWCHIRSRRYKATRWEPTNAWTGCHSCHEWAHGNSPEAKAFIERIAGGAGALADLKQRSLRAPVLPPSQIEAALVCMLEAYDRG
jgi:hypothetical protein